MFQRPLDVALGPSAAMGRPCARGVERVLLFRFPHSFVRWSSRMRLGLTVGYSGAQVAIDMDLVREAEAAGFDSVWTAEAWGSDAVSPAAWILAQTSRIRVGTGI